MSRYCSVKTQFKNEKALIAALIETGEWTQEQIEVHQEAANLFGFKGDMRDEKCHIIIRRANIGTVSNDIGFRRTETGEYEAMISDYDKRKYGERWCGELKGNYAFHTISQRQRARGRTVTRERMPNGRQQITIGGYR